MIIRLASHPADCYCGVNIGGIEDAGLVEYS